MKTEWDYSNLAEAYLKRPNYAGDAIDELLSISNVSKGDLVCDVGAGVAHLTLELAARDLQVSAVEPNDEMRKLGIKRTENLPNVSWTEGVGEATKQPDKHFKLVTFGSSFNVCDRAQALLETQRILQPNGWFACMWNHRKLTDPVQAEIESIIKSSIEDYGYGSRREDQTAEINKSNLFGQVVAIEAEILHYQTPAEIVEAWRSHATLHRQAGDAFHTIIERIEQFVTALNEEKIAIPYTTRMWAAQLK